MANEHTLKISYKGDTKSYKIRHGLGIIALCQKEETPLQFDCRAADCGICVVKVLQGMENISAPDARESDFLRAMHAAADERLACQCNILGDVELEVEF